MMAKSKPINKQHFQPNFDDLRMPEEGEIPPVLQGDPQAQFYGTGQAQPQQELWQQSGYIPEEPTVYDQEDTSDSPIQGEFEAESGYEETLEQPAPSQPQPKPSFKEKDENLKYFREALERSERERIRAEQQREEYAKMILSQKNTSPVNNIKPEDESIDFDVYGDDDSLSEKKDVKKIAGGVKAVDKKYKERFEAQEKRLQQLEVDMFIRNKYKDFDNVVSEDNVRKLNELHPEIAKTIYETKDYYSKTVAAYSILKQYGIAQAPEVESRVNTVIENIGKPKVGAAVAGTPAKRNSPFDSMGRFDKNSEQTRLNLLRSMREAQRNR